MTFINVNVFEVFDTLARITTAFLLGSVIGFERQHRQSTAGLRTNVLVCLGAAIFVDAALRVSDPDGAVRVISYVVSGIGFLGAGVIMREGGRVQGLNTAATLWTSGAIGACAGVGLLIEAVIGTIFILIANTTLRPVVNYINGLSFSKRKTHLSSVIHITTSKSKIKDAVFFLERAIESDKYHLSDFQIKSFSETEVKINLISTSVFQNKNSKSANINDLIFFLSAEPSIDQVSLA